MIKADNFTRAEICAFLEKSREDEKSLAHCGWAEIYAHNNLLDYLIEEFSDPDLALDTETGFFVYTGPELPSIPVNR